MHRRRRGHRHGPRIMAEAVADHDGPGQTVRGFGRDGLGQGRAQQGAVLAVANGDAADLGLGPGGQLALDLRQCCVAGGGAAGQRLAGAAVIDQQHDIRQGPRRAPLQRRSRQRQRDQQQREAAPPRPAQAPPQRDPSSQHRQHRYDGGQPGRRDRADKRRQNRVQHERAPGEALVHCAPSCARRSSSAGTWIWSDL